MAEERLQKVLARAGYGSRRGCEVLLRAGRVRVDGRVATLGERADAATQRIEVDGEPLPALTTQHAVIALHKPRDYVVTANDELGRSTVYDLLPDAPVGLRYAGRLDRDSEGLLLLTTDGELINRITHPRYELDRVYDALLDAVPDESDLNALREGVVLDDGPARAHRIERLDRRLVRLTLREGRNREVRRMFEVRGLTVTRLVRRAVGPIGLGALAPGDHRQLTDIEDQTLRRAVDLDVASAASLSSRDRGSRGQPRRRRDAGERPPRRDRSGR